MGPEGMEKFCEDIGVEPENVSVYLIQVSLSTYIYIPAHFSCLL